MADISHGRADVISGRVNLRTVRIGFDFKGNDLRPEQAAQGQYVVSNNLFPKELYGQQFTLPNCFLSFFGKN